MEEGVLPVFRWVLAKEKAEVAYLSFELGNRGGLCRRVALSGVSESLLKELKTGFAAITSGIVLLVVGPCREVVCK